MKARLAPPLSSERLALAACAAVFALSMWLRAAFPLLCLSTMEFDDLLFARLAQHIREGDWLGPYGNLTLAKGAAFPSFVAAVSLTGIPYKLAEHFLYLCACWFFARTVSRWLRFRHAMFVVFTVMALNPVVWAPEAGGRLLRENFYVSLVLLLIALAFRLFLPGQMPSPERDRRRRIALLVSFGLIGGVFWLTREEGVWILPALSLPIAYGFLCQVRNMGARAAAFSAARSFAIAAAGFAAVVLAVNTLNYRHYGTFRNNEFRSSDFQAAYGALARIEHDNFRRYVVFPKDARERAYAASVNARSLRPTFEGPAAAAWMQVGCHHLPVKPCDEVLSGWFMWQLRDAVRDAGHYRTAREAEAFYKAMAGEINAACDERRIPCGPPLATLVPRWHAEFVGWTLESAARLVQTLALLGRMSIRLEASVASEEQLSVARGITHETTVSADDRAPEGLRFTLARWITHAQRAIHVVGLVLAVVALGIALPSARLNAGVVAVATILVAVASRVILLAFLDATSIPSDNIWYLSPVVPLSLAFGPAAVLLWAQSRGPRTSLHS